MTAVESEAAARSGHTDGGALEGKASIDRFSHDEAALDQSSG
ncbi:hypothetical protein [Streptomyces sp. NPDC058295]